MDKNKVIFGLKNVHYAPLTEEDGVITYGTPVRIPGAVELSIEPLGEMTKFYADDIIYYSASANNGYEGTVTFARISDAFMRDVMGEVHDEEDGVIHEYANAKPKQFAFLFEFTGDESPTRHVLYYCAASRPSTGSGTKSESLDIKTVELKFTASPRPSDELVKTKATKPGTPVYDAWYTAVYEKVEAA